ncbi:hypothetical protein [Gordonia sp. NPDC058843]|uniref:hypothetical protein n=1 Tax=Gordonia sp. NPDC058843 TaxID=3346648 RepID=UPI00369BF56D
MTNPLPPDQEAVWTILQRLEPIWDRLQRSDFELEPGSAVYYDNQQLSGFYQISHHVDRAIQTSIGHWRAIMQALFEDGRGWLFSHYAMARPAIENAACAYWLLKPDSRRERIHNLLLLAWDNDDQNRKAFNAAQQPDGAQECRAKQAVIEELAKHNGTPFPVKNQGVKYIQMVQSVPQHPAMSSVESAWRITSGMAHGKWWAFEHLSAATPHTDLGGGVRQADFSLDFEQLKVVAGIGVYTLEQAVSLYDRRRRSPLDVQTM